MPYSENQGVKIHYQVEGKGVPLLIQHGYTTSLQRWHEFGYVKSLKERYMLVLVDARGHGESDKPHHKKDYEWSLRAADLLSVADDLGLDRFHFWGYSMGGIYGYNLAAVAPQRIISLIIGGADPFATSFDAFTGIDGSNQDEFVTAMENLLDERFGSATIQRMLANDLRAMAAAAVDRPTLEQEVLDSTLSCLLYVGDQDIRHAAVKRFSESMPSSVFASITGKNHAETMASSELVLPHVEAFLGRF